MVKDAVQQPYWYSEWPVAFSSRSAWDFFCEGGASFVYVVNRETMQVRLVNNVVQANEFFETGEVSSY